MSKSLTAAAVAAVLLLIPTVSKAANSGGYVRLDTGASIQNRPTWRSADLSQSFSGSQATEAIGGIGIGYRFSPLFRMDLDATYRPEFDVTHTDNQALLAYKGKENSWRVMLTGYADMADLIGRDVVGHINPYAGFGLGLAWNYMGRMGVTDLTAPAFASQFTVNGRTRAQLAWQLVAGASYDVTEQWALDVAYRYLDSGQARGGDSLVGDGVNQPIDPFHARLTSNEVSVSLRYSF